MDRMAFIPGAEAKDEMFKAEGHIFFQRSTASAYCDEFLATALGQVSSITFQTMLACLSEGDQVDIWFGLRDPDQSKGQEELASGEPVGHTWAVLNTADGRKQTLWEVGRATPAAGEAHAARAFNAYRDALAFFKDEEPPPHVPVDVNQANMPAEFNGKPVISHALAPANIYHASSRMWYFIDLGPLGELHTPACLTRPMRAFDALILAALMTLVNGSPPLVFGIANTMETIGKVPGGYVRATYEEDKTLSRSSDTPLVVL